MKKDAASADDRLISGRLRPKAARRGAVNTTVAVGGVEYVWSYRHGWLVWGKGVRAISVSVALRPTRTRELILDFTVSVGPNDDMPSESRLVAALPDAIAAAIAAGWDPESRGRAFRHEIAEPL